MIAQHSPRSDWRTRARCKGQTALFFPPMGELTDKRIVRERAAKKICQQCPVIGECRDWARANREPGVWGGETEADRRAAGIDVPMLGRHDRDDDTRRRQQAEQELAALVMRDVPLAQLEQIAQLAAAIDQSDDQ